MGYHHNPVWVSTDIHYGLAPISSMGKHWYPVWVSMDIQYGLLPYIQYGLSLTPSMPQWLRHDPLLFLEGYFVTQYLY